MLKTPQTVFLLADAVVQKGRNLGHQPEGVTYLEGVLFRVYAEGKGELVFFFAVKRRRYALVAGKQE